MSYKLLERQVRSVDTRMFDGSRVPKHIYSINYEVYIRGEKYQGAEFGLSGGCDVT